jgi:hypothetical protein
MSSGDLLIDVDAMELRSRFLNMKSNVFLAFARKIKRFVVNLHKTCVPGTSRPAPILPMSSTTNSKNPPAWQFHEMSLDEATSLLDGPSFTFRPKKIGMVAIANGCHRRLK